jgi:hypothetical protein
MLPYQNKKVVHWVRRWGLRMLLSACSGFAAFAGMAIGFGAAAGSMAADSDSFQTAAEASRAVVAMTIIAGIAGGIIGSFCAQASIDQERFDAANRSGH